MESQQYQYTKKEERKVMRYIERQFGKYERILSSEKDRFGVQLGIIVFPPTDEQPFYKLVTKGAGAIRMDRAPKGNPKRAEYVIFLPPEWDMKFEEESSYWPLDALYNVLEIPLAEGGWLASGARVEWGRPLAENVGFDSFLLTAAIGRENQPVQPLRLKLFGDKLYFYHLFPLYPEEREQARFENREDFLAYLERFDINDMIIDVNRPKRGI